MRTVNIHEAKTHLSWLVEEVAAGQEVIIAKAGKPMARLVPLELAPKKRRLGLFTGQLKVPDDFDAPFPEDVLASFEGGQASGSTAGYPRPVMGVGYAGAPAQSDH